MSQPSSASSNRGPVPSVHSYASSFLDPNEARQRLERSQQQWSKTTEQLAELVRTRSSTPHMSPMEMSTSDRQIHELQKRLKAMEIQMRDYESQLKTAETTILQQKMTIRNQSKAIENPRASRDGAATPLNQSRVYGRHGPTQHLTGPSSNFELQGPQRQFGDARPALTHGGSSSAQSTPRYQSTQDWDRVSETQLIHHAPQPFTNSGTHSANNYGSPQQRRPVQRSTYSQMDRQAGSGTTFGKYGAPNTNDPFGPPPTTGVSSHNSLAHQMEAVMSLRSPESTTSSNPYPETSLKFVAGPSTTMSDTGAEAKIKELCQKTFDMTIKYTRDHVNFPSTSGDNALPQATKDKLVDAATASSAFPLMSSGNSRYLLVTRIMLSWMVRHVLRYNTFSGLDTSIDQVIEGTKATIYQSTPDQLRYLLMSNMANEVKKIRDKPDFKAFANHLTKQRAGQLWTLVSPMMHQKTAHDYEDLMTLMRQVHKLAEVVFTSTDEVRFDFPEAAITYDPTTMINIDPQFANYTVDGLRSLQITVRLGVTPIISARRNVAQGRSTSVTMQKAFVLLKAPRM